jgi:hypothetical protein
MEQQKAIVDAISLGEISLRMSCDEAKSLTSLSS